MVPWPSGKAKVCNTSIPGSIPGGASKKKTSSSRDWFSFWKCYRTKQTRFRKRSATESGTQHSRLARNSGYAHEPSMGEVSILRMICPFYFEIFYLFSDSPIK